MSKNKRKEILRAALAAKAARVGSTATTIRGMGRAVLGAMKPSDVIGHADHGRRKYPLALRDPYRDSIAARQYREQAAGARIRAKAEAKPSYRLPARAETTARELLAGIRREQYQDALKRTAEHVRSDLRQRFGLTAIERDMAATWPLRQSESSWAGGEHTIKIEIEQSPGCMCETAKVWSTNGKWSGTNSCATLQVTIGALVHFPTLRTKDGSIVLDADRIGPREYRLVWAAQARGVGIRPQSGFLIRGYHSKRATLDAARREAAGARSRAADMARSKRAAAGLPAPLKSIYVDLADSLAAGNCETQSKNFARRAWGKIGATAPTAVRADIVLRLRDDYFTRRAVSAAQQRKGDSAIVFSHAGISSAS